MAPSEIQPDPPEPTLVENEGVDAGELTDRAGPDDPDAASAARKGGRPERAQEQVDDAEQAGPDELAGAPGGLAQEDDGGQDSGRMS